MLTTSVDYRKFFAQANRPAKKKEFLSTSGDDDFSAVELELRCRDTGKTPFPKMSQVLLELEGLFLFEQLQRGQNSSNANLGMPQQILEDFEGVGRRDVHIGEDPPCFSEVASTDLSHLSPEVGELGVMLHRRRNVGRVDAQNLRSTAEQRLRCSAGSAAQIEAPRFAADRKTRPSQAGFEFPPRPGNGVRR